MIDKCGFFVNPAFPQVGASPDAIVTCTCCGKGCVEVKCPAKYKDCTILQACSSDDRNFCLHVVDGQVHLKKDHQYYTQVQTQLFVTESSYCDFVVWTLKDTVILCIAPDNAFWNARLKKAQDFFVKVALPELAVQYFTNPPTSQPSSGHSVLQELQQPQKVGEKRQRKKPAKKKKQRDQRKCGVFVPDKRKVKWWPVTTRTAQSSGFTSVVWGLWTVPPLTRHGFALLVLNSVISFIFYIFCSFALITVL